MIALEFMTPSLMLPPTSQNPFEQSVDGRALLIVNGVTFGAVTQDEYLRLDWLEEAALLSADEDVIRPPAAVARVCSLPHEIEEANRLTLTLEMIASELQGQLTSTRQLVAIFLTLLARLTDPTHLSVAEAARVERVTEKTIRNRVKRGRYQLERVPGSSKSGIPVEQIYSGWLDLRVARRILADETKEASLETKRT